MPTSKALATRAFLVLAFAVVLSSAACLPGDGDDAGKRESLLPTATTRALLQPEGTPQIAESAGAVTGKVTMTVQPAFVWPAEGPITSFIGPEHPDGIDIGLSAPSLTIRASSAGLVTYAGGSDEESLGLSIVIDHGSGVTTTYGHLSDLVVEEGDQVTTGQVLGVGGDTGRADGVHLHFEVRKDGATVDPLAVLPSDSQTAHVEENVCGSRVSVLPAGSDARLNFADLLLAGEKVVGAQASGTLSAAIGRAGTVLVRAAVDFDGPVHDEPVRLEVTIDSGTGNRVVGCDLAVAHRSVPTVFYVRVEPLSPGEAAPQPTPTPTSTAQPHYGTPAFSEPVAPQPQYTGSGSASPGAQEPSFAPPSGPRLP